MDDLCEKVQIDVIKNDVKFLMVAHLVVRELQCMCYNSTNWSSRWLGSKHWSYVGDSLGLAIEPLPIALTVLPSRED